MVWTKAGGDENKARAAYVEARVREITSEQAHAAKAARPPLAQRINWMLVLLIVCTLIFTFVNDAVARSVRPSAPVPRWDFWLLGIAGSALGLFLFPAFFVLISWGKPWGFRFAVLALIIAGCISGTNIVPEFAPDYADVAGKYRTTGVFLGIGWIIYMACVYDPGAPTIPD